MAKNRRGKAAGRRKQLQRLNKELYEIGTFDPLVFEKAEAEFRARQPPPPPTPTYRSCSTLGLLPISEKLSRAEKRPKRLLAPPSSLPSSIFERRPTKPLPLDACSKKRDSNKERAGPHIRTIESVKLSIRKENNKIYIKKNKKENISKGVM